MILSVCKVSSTNVKATLTTLVLAAFSFMTRMSPEFQINYIWVFTLVLIFIKFFLDGKPTNKWWKLSLFTMVAFFAGLAHDVINVGVAGAIVLYWCMHRKDFTLKQYLMAVSFGVGALILLLAPGNFCRAQEIEPFVFITSVKNLLFSFRTGWILAVVTVIAKFKHGKKFSEIYRENSLYWNAMFICLLFVFLLGVPGHRSVFGAELMAIVLIIKLLKNNCFSSWLVLLSTLCLIVVVGNQIIGTSVVKRQYDAIQREYKESGDGNVYTDVVMLTNDDNFLPNPYMIVPFSTSGDRAYQSFQKWMRATTGLRKPYIEVLPDFLRGKDSIDIGNQVVDYGDGAYLLVQSKLDPMRFYINREINILGLVNKRYDPLEIKFDKIIKETDFWRAQLVTENDYTIMGLSNNEITIQQ